jgi:hypothetical protein
MISIRVWRRYINITITILDIIHRPVFYLNHTVDNVRASQESRHHYEPNRLMRSIGLWRWCINKTIKILGIIHRLVFYVKQFRSWILFPSSGENVAGSGPIFWTTLREKFIPIKLLFNIFKSGFEFVFRNVNKNKAILEIGYWIP